ncbi:MAG: hypothetical protein ABIJ12_04115 [bacterium]
MSKATTGVLSETIHKIRKRIIRLKDRRKKIGEENTKAVLIDPILHALGWNTGELEEVCHEYRRKSKDNPVDYALFLLRKECLFIESKALEKDIDDHKWILQTLSYATSAGVEWCILTNGDEYRLYNTTAPIPAEEKLFRKFQISDSSMTDYAIETLILISKEKMGENILKVLWRAHFIDGHVKNALRQILSHDEASIIRLIKKKTQAIQPSEIRESLKRADIQIEFPIMPVNITPPVVPPGVVNPTITPKTDSLSDLVKAAHLKTPLSIEATYKKKRFTATIQADGTVLFDNEIYSSLSTAAGMARATIRKPPTGRKYPQTNGWSFWKYMDPVSEKLTKIDTLRKRSK